MIVSKGCIHAFRSAIYLALTDNRNSYVAIKKIATDLNISFHFLAKIIQLLAQHGIMDSYRGPNGGATLARPPEEIRLIDIVTVIEGSDIFTECFFGLPGCGELTPCPVHDYWSDTRTTILSYFERTTLAELADKVDNSGLRLAEALEKVDIY